MSGIEAARVPPSHARLSVWRVWASARAVAHLELEQARRSRAHWMLLAGWAVAHLIALVVLLLTVPGARGPRIFSVFACMAVTGAIGAGPVHAVVQAIRERGTRARDLLRATGTVAWSVVLGKLLATIAVSAVWFAVPLMFAMVPMAMEVSPLRWLGLVIVCLVFATLTAATVLGLAHSFASPRAGAVVAALVVLLVSLGSLGLYRLSIPLVTGPERIQTYWQYEAGQPCIFRMDTVELSATNQTWWLTLPSPYVAAADILSGGREQTAAGADRDFLVRGQNEVRDARTGTPTFVDRCDDGKQEGRHLIKAPNWPYTVLINLGLALAGVMLAFRAFGTPRG